MIIDSPIISGSYAASGSLNQVGNVVISGSLTVTGSIIGTASFAETASYLSGYVSPFPFTGSAIISGSFTVTGSANIPNITGSLSGSLNGTASYAVTASNAVTASYLTGYVSPFPFTGSAVISGSLGVTGSLQVTNLSGSGVRYLVADESGSVTAQSASAALKSTQAFTSTAGQTTFSVTNGYATGYVDVFINGSKLNSTEFTDTSGTNIVLATGSFSGDVVEVVKYTPAAGVTNNVLRQLTSFTATVGQTVFSASYTPGLIDIFYNGSRLSTSDYTANNGTFFTLATASAANDLLDVLVYSYQVGAFNGIGGQGVTSQIAYFNTTSSITGSNNFTISGSTMTVTGSLLVSGSGTFTNIGPAILSGTTTLSGSAVLTGSLNVSGAIVTNSTITAQTLVVQTITSSVSVMTGSTNFGSLLANTHTFTGSLNVTGSLSVVTTGTELQVTNTGVRIGNVSTDVHPITGSVNVSGSATFSSSVDGTIFNSTSNAFRFSGNNAISLASLDAQNVVKINAAGYWGTQLVGANDRGILINNVGNVGIGTTSPDAGLNVETDFTAFNALAIRSSNAFSTTPETSIAFRTKFNTAGAYSTNGLVVGYKNNATDGDQQGGLQFWTNAGSGVAEKMRITSAGFVGINVAGPTARFHIISNDTPSISGTTPTGAFAIQSTATTALTMGVNPNGPFNGWIQMRHGALADITYGLMIQPLGGVVVMGTSSGNTSGATLQVEGTGNFGPLSLRFANAASGRLWKVGPDNGNNFIIYNENNNGAYINYSATSWTGNSDIRLKNVINPITDAILKLSELNPIVFSWKSDDTNKENLGLVAQDVEKVFPQVIDVNSEGMLGIRYSELIPVLVKAIQEQQTLITELQEKLERNNII